MTSRSAPARPQATAAPAFPNLITHVATTEATVPGTQMTSVICDDLARKNLAPACAVNLLRLHACWTGTPPDRRQSATWHASNSASPHDLELTSVRS
jgi:hypothetical protein